MRVLVLCGSRGIPLYGPSGASAHLRAMTSAWVRRGHRVTVAAPLSSDHRGHWGALLPHRAVHVPPRRWPSFLRFAGEKWDARRLVSRAIDDGPPDLIWERHTLFCDAGRRLAARQGVARIVELNAPLSIERPGLKNRRRAAAIEAKNLQSATRVIAVSKWLADWAVQDMGCEADRVFHVPNGTSLSRKGDRQTTRKRLGLSGLVIGFAGSCKAFHHLELLPALLDELPTATALVVGDGPCPPPAHPRLHHLGRVPQTDLPDLISAMDVGLSTSVEDDHPWRCPLKILDYQSQGVPVVSADVGDARALLPQGVLVHGRDPSDWADAIRLAAASTTPVLARSWDTVLEEAMSGL